MGQDPILGPGWAGPRPAGPGPGQGQAQARARPRPVARRQDIISPATKPFPIVFSVADMIAGYDKIKAHAESGRHIIPGHDPLVLARYPALNAATEGIIGRLDVDPQD